MKSALLHGGPWDGCEYKVDSGMTEGLIVDGLVGPLSRAEIADMHPSTVSTVWGIYRALSASQSEFIWMGWES